MLKQFQQDAQKSRYYEKRCEFAKISMQIKALKDVVRLFLT